MVSGSSKTQKISPLVKKLKMNIIHFLPFPVVQEAIMFCKMQCAYRLYWLCCCRKEKFWPKGLCPGCGWYASLSIWISLIMITGVVSFPIKITSGLMAMVNGSYCERQVWIKMGEIIEQEAQTSHGASAEIALMPPRVRDIDLKPPPVVFPINPFSGVSRWVFRLPPLTFITKFTRWGWTEKQWSKSDFFMKWLRYSSKIYYQLHTWRLIPLIVRGKCLKIIVSFCTGW